MKKIVTVLAALSVVFVALASKPEKRRTVVYRTSIECKNCKNKVMENISFEKGVKDVSVNLPEKSVMIVFNETKTDTLTLANAIRKLGYSAHVIKFE